MSMIKNYLHDVMDDLDAMADIEMERIEILNEIADHQAEQAMDQPEPTKQS